MRGEEPSLKVTFAVATIVCEAAVQPLRYDCFAACPLDISPDSILRLGGHNFETRSSSSTTAVRP